MLYPNPATNIVNISFTNIKQVQVMDIAGKLVLNTQGSGVNNMQINVGAIGKGMFFVRVMATEGSTETRKLVVE